MDGSPTCGSLAASAELLAPARVPALSLPARHVTGAADVCVSFEVADGAALLDAVRHLQDHLRTSPGREFECVSWPARLQPADLALKAEYVDLQVDGDSWWFKAYSGKEHFAAFSGMFTVLELAVMLENQAPRGSLVRVHRPHAGGV